jgi:Cu(I)/Ag(I) efflux system membrane fusion protein
MNRLNNPAMLLLMICCLLAMGGMLGWWLAMRSNHTAAHQQTMPVVAERKVLYWYDPMMPQQHFDQPGKSPFMDMQLIAKYADEEQTSALSIDPLRSENIGVRLATVSRIPLSRQIDVSGLIAFNDRDVAILQSRSGGFVERVWPLAAGDVVKAGQPIVEILQPEWAAAQQEWLAVRTLNDKALQTAARERLQLLGMPESLIRHLETSGAVQTRYTVSAPIAGVIQALEVRNGMTLPSGQTLARINGLASVWLEVAVPEAQITTLGIGDSAEVRLSAFPERSIEGKVAAILPMLNETSRSVRVRVELKNPRLQLRPGMTAQVRLSSTNAGTGLAVPTEALIRTGKRTLVMLAREKGRFSPQEIWIDQEIGAQTIVTAGLEEGQQVVSSGLFLIDSEASLNGIEAHSLATENPPAMENTP